MLEKFMVLENTFSGFLGLELDAGYPESIEDSRMKTVE